MSLVEESIQVAVPVREAYDQWTQFEEFPRFMRHFERIEQLDDTHLHWTVNVAGHREEFDAEITEQIPDARIAWRSTSGPSHAGAVDFHRLGDDQTQLMVTMDFQPQGAMEKAADALDLFERELREDLGNFRELIESRGQASGEWRGEVRPEGSGES